MIERRHSRMALVVFAIIARCHELTAQSTAAPFSVPALHQDQLLTAFRVLAADSMEGREAGSRGAERARRFLLREFERIGLKPLVPRFALPFRARYLTINSVRKSADVAPGERGFTEEQRGRNPSSVTVDGVNLLGVVRGSETPERFIVISAHYDHIGRDGQNIYNGANDNASGSAAILVIAEWFVSHPPRNTLVFAWFDAEEEGLLGSTAFVAKPPIVLDSIIADVNVDMISRSVKGELFAAGGAKWPAMVPLLDSISALNLVTLKRGHDEGRGDWTQRSDQGPFHDRGIPFVHFGVEEQDEYHKPSDVAARVQPAFYFRNTVMIAEFIRRADASSDNVAVFRRKP